MIYNNILFLFVGSQLTALTFLTYSIIIQYTIKLQSLNPIIQFQPSLISD